MSESYAEKTEQPTPRRLEEALKRGQMARSAEVQTAFVLLGGIMALVFAGREMWQQLVGATATTLAHLHDTPISASALQGYGVAGVRLLVQCLGPVVAGTAVAGLLAGAIQNRFNTASEALTPDWNRLNPVEGVKRLFSTRMVVPTAIAIGKLVLIIALTWTEVRSVLNDPIFTTSVSVARVGTFLAETGLRVFVRVVLVLGAIAAADYAYQWWRTHRDLMMTREELKEELKNTEGNPRIKAARRRRRYLVSKARALAQVPQADVVVTNPTHIAVALRYDRKTMRAPKVVAKGIRLQAERIRQIAQRYHVPLVENKPLARLLFRHVPEGGEVPASLYAAVAEVLAWVYRINRYRYYTEQNQT